jgi:hypothetical protein
MDTALNSSKLETQLLELGASPQDNGHLEMIVCRPDLGERRLLEQATLNTEVGLVGDNWLTRGSRHTDDGSALLAAQITLMNRRVIEAIEPDRDRWPLAGDQLFVDFDLSADNCPVGQQLAIGSVVLEISEMPHTGCKKFTERFGSEATRLVNSPQGRHLRRRGVNARVIQAGTVSVGDRVMKI